MTLEQSLELLKYKIDGRTTIEEIGERYVPEQDANQAWLSKVTLNYNIALEEYDDLFGKIEEKEEVTEIIKEEKDSSSILDTDVVLLESTYTENLMNGLTSDFMNEKFKKLKMQQKVEFKATLLNESIEDMSLESASLSFIEPIEGKIEDIGYEKNDDIFLTEDSSSTSAVNVTNEGQSEILDEPEFSKEEKTISDEIIEEEQTSSDTVTAPSKETDLLIATPSNLEELYIVDNPTRDMMNELYESYMEERRIELEEQAKREAEEEKIRLEEERVQEEKAYTKLYCDIYGLDYEKVYQILSNITDDFKDEEYLSNYVIGDSMLKKRYIICDSKEMAFLIAIRNIYYDPSRYGYPNDDLRTGIEYISNLDYSHQISYVCNVVGIDAALSYAICESECSFNSPMFLNKNNPAGIKFDSGFATFPSKTAGFIEQSLVLLKYKIDGLTTIESIGYRYAPVDDPANSTWIPNVTSNYSKALANYDELFGNIEVEPIEIAEAKIYTLSR